ncbi:MAG: cohesin domain-containing protein [Acidobacteriia bacterium]|nr:cohesin domain-containing protein [Terriglobia bacterium]
MTSSLTEVAINQTFTAEIVASSDAGVVDAPFHLLFDPAVLEFLDATQGEFLGEDGSSIIFIVNGRARPGDVAIGIGRANREQGASGTGVLARIRFSALAPGETYLRLDRSVAWDAGGNRMEVSTVGVAVAVR